MDRGELARRPIPARESRWAAVAARGLARLGFTPNGISLLSIGVSGLAGLCFVVGGRSGAVGQAALFVLAVGLMGLRLLCNLFDGMLAVELGMKSKSGGVYNDLPDRISDALILVGAGYGAEGVAWGAALGWAAALLAVMTAYVRLLGGALGVTQDFGGPMAKQQRMAVLGVAALIAAALAATDWGGRVLAAGLAVVVVGCAVTVARRAARVVRELEAP
jgi:phosphatidylglycerophosphate synthase